MVRHSGFPCYRVARKRGSKEIQHTSYPEPMNSSEGLAGMAYVPQGRRVPKGREFWSEVGEAQAQEVTRLGFESQLWHIPISS